MNIGKTGSAGLQAVSALRNAGNANRADKSETGLVITDSATISGTGRGVNIKEEQDPPVEPVRVPVNGDDEKVKSSPQETVNKEKKTESFQRTIMTEDTIADSSAGSPGGVNFAQLFGVEKGSDSPSIPQNFTREEVEAHYFRTNAENAKDAGDLSIEGQRFLSRIKEKYIDRVPDTKHGYPILYLTGGLPGCGKGYTLKIIMGDDPEFVLIDPDEIKKDIMKDLLEKNPSLSSQMEKDSKWSDVVHETSSFMSKQLFPDAFKSGKDIVYDSTMGSKGHGKYKKLAETAKENSYRVYGFVVNVPVELSIKRAEERMKQPVEIKTDDGRTVKIPGRYVSEDYIRKCEGEIRRNHTACIEERIFDMCITLDNSDPDKPARVKSVFARGD